MLRTKGLTEFQRPHPSAQPQPGHLLHYYAAFQPARTHAKIMKSLKATQGETEQKTVWVTTGQAFQINGNYDQCAWI
eukprot:scaffold93290_cov20-Prasinocladus_malaysianus.AAC.1